MQSAYFNCTAERVHVLAMYLGAAEAYGIVPLPENLQQIFV